METAVVAYIKVLFHDTLRGTGESHEKTPIRIVCFEYVDSGENVNICYAESDIIHISYWPTVGCSCMRFSGAICSRSHGITKTT
jgi:hypothetical protein